MAEDAVDALLKANEELINTPSDKQRPDSIINTYTTRGCHTTGLRLIGSAGYSPDLANQLLPSAHSLVSDDVVKHLAHNYGGHAPQVLQLAKELPSGKQLLAQGYPFIEAEVHYGCRYEYAQSAVDVLANRTRLVSTQTDQMKNSVIGH